jgi:hypothetical protein
MNKRVFPDERPFFLTVLRFLTLKHNTPDSGFRSFPGWFRGCPGSIHHLRLMVVFSLPGGRRNGHPAAKTLTHLYEQE